MKTISKAGAVTAKFTGTGIHVIATKGPTCGQMEITIDGVVQSPNSDLYAGSLAYQQDVFHRSGFANTTHTLSLAWTGQKNTSSSATTITLDALDVEGTLTSADHNALPMPQNMAKPAAGVPFIDPVFGTKVMRITNAAAASRPGIVPDYSKRQAWNCDESLLLLRAGDGTALLYDGSSYKFIKPLDEVGGEDVFWSPTDPSVILYNPGHELWAFNVETGSQYLVLGFDGYEFASTRGEGNLSRNATSYAAVASTYDAATAEVRHKKLLLVTLSTTGGKLTGTIAASLDLPQTLTDFDWVSVSPGGNYIVVDYATTTTGRFQGVEVYDRSFTFLWQKPLGYGHSDLGIDANGDEILVMDVYDPDANQTSYMKYRLADGKETELLTVDWSFYDHISLRNTDQPGWCLVSTYDGEGRLSDSPAKWLPFEDEIFLVKLDGSGDVERLAHHHSRRYSPATPDADTSAYFAEPHATASPKGDRILFGSNWRQGMDKVESVDAYVLDLKGC